MVFIPVRVSPVRATLQPLLLSLIPVSVPLNETVLFLAYLHSRAVPEPATDMHHGAANDMHRGTAWQFPQGATRSVLDHSSNHKDEVPQGAITQVLASSHANSHPNHGKANDTLTINGQTHQRKKGV